MKERVGTFKVGQRVRVTYEGTVTHTTQYKEEKPAIRDDHGYNHYGVRPEYAEIITPPPPYVDGMRYVDQHDNRMYFTARGHNGGPGWSYKPGSADTYDYERAGRPLRPITYGDEIQEQGTA